MIFQGFSEQDFDTFLVDGLEERMAAIRSGPRPKLEALGHLLAPILKADIGHDFFPHVAKHARRKVNPPSDTWVALSGNRKGYKMTAHFQVGLWPTHLFIRAGVIYEAEGRGRFATNVLANLPRLREDIPAHYTWLDDYTKPCGRRHDSMTEADFVRLAERLTTRRQADAMVGLEVDRAEAVRMDDAEIYRLVAETFHSLVPVYRLATM